MHELDSWNKEKRSAYLYRIISDVESGTVRQLLFLELAKEADSQAALWLSELKKSGNAPPEKYSPGLHIVFLAWLIQKLGPRKLKPLLIMIRIRGLSVYSGHHADILTLATAPDNVGTRLRTELPAWLKTACFGVNDGLASIACLVMGVAGAYHENSLILLVGVAGLLAGAISIAAGEFISVRAQREFLDDQLAPEPAKPAHYSSREAAELALIYRARGLSARAARNQAWRMIDDLEIDQEPLEQEESSRQPQQADSPWGAALSSFFAFVTGGVIPLLPYLLAARRHPLLISIVLSALALFGSGAMLSRFAGRGPLWGGLRMLLIGAAAGAVAYLIGSYLGA